MGRVNRTLNIITNLKCNESCGYCAMYGYSRDEDIDINDIDRYLPKILDQAMPYSIKIIGGEPGLTDIRSHIRIAEIYKQYCINNIYPHIGLINISTNGTFYKKYNDYLLSNKYYDISYQYHLTPEYYIHNPKDLIVDDRIEYTILVHNKNYMYLDEFLSKSENLPHRYNLLMAFRDGTEYHIDDSVNEYLYSIFLKYKNILAESDNDFIKNKKNNVSDIKDITEYCCKNLMLTIKADFINKVMCPCCLYYNNGVPFDSVLNNSLIDDLSNLNGFSCDICDIHIRQLKWMMPHMAALARKATSKEVRNKIMKYWYTNA